MTQKTKVFISYSRKNRVRIEGLFNALSADEGLQIFRDTNDILPTEEWKPRLKRLILESDVVLFALSPDSTASTVCAWELEISEQLNKRIIPVVVENVDGNVPEAVSKLNYVFLTEADDFEQSLARIQEAISLDIEWLREHTRLGEMADRWEQTRRIGAQPLRGRELEQAENWMVGQPKGAPSPTGLHRQFIHDSRVAQAKRQRWALISACAAIVVVGVLAAAAVLQRNEAQLQRNTAHQEYTRAESALVEAQTELHQRQIVQARLMGRNANILLDEGRPDWALAVAVAAFPESARDAWDEIDAETGASAPLRASLGASRLVRSYHRGERFTQHRSIFSPDGTQIVTFSMDGTGTIRVWNFLTGEETLLVRYEEDPWTSGAFFSPDGERIFIQGGSGSYYIWEIASGNSLPHDPQNEFGRGTLSLDGTRMVSSANGGDYPRVYDTETGEELAALQFQQGRFGTAGFSPDGRRILTASYDGTARLWDAYTGEELLRLIGHGQYVEAAGFSPDGLRIVTGSSDGVTRIWDATTGDVILQLSVPGGFVGSAEYSPGGTLIVTTYNDGTARVWDAHTGTELYALRGPASPADAIFSPDGLHIIVSYNTGIINVWNIAPNTVQLSESDDDRLYHFASFDPNNQRIVASSRSGHLTVWDTETGYLDYAINTGSLQSVRFSDDGSRIIGASNSGGAMIWDARTGQEQLRMPGRGGSSLYASFSPDGTLAVASTSIGYAQVWDAATGSEMHVLDGHDGHVWSAVFSPDGASIVTTGDDLTARIWSVATGEETQTLVGHGNRVWRAYFSDDGSEIVTISHDGTARVWDAQTGAARLVLHSVSDTDVFHDAAFSQDGRSIVALSNKGTVQIWDAETGEQTQITRGYYNGNSQLEFSPDGSQFLMTSGSRVPQILNIQTLEDAVDMAQLRAEQATALSTERLCEFFLQVEDCN